MRSDSGQAGACNERGCRWDEGASCALRCRPLQGGWVPTHMASHGSVHGLTWQEGGGETSHSGDHQARCIAALAIAIGVNRGSSITTSMSISMGTITPSITSAPLPVAIRGGDLKGGHSMLQR